MKLTVRDVSNFPELSKLTLIAGRGGLKKAIIHCGILDYEYDKDVASKYYDYNYQVDGDFLTLSTFLYAKKNPNLIYDAVKKLVSKNGSGLIIKNIFKLPISENVIRYADHMDFPIFILNDSYPFFEDILLLVNKAIEKYDSIYYQEQKVTSLFSVPENDMEAVSRAVTEINPFIQDDIMSIYFRYDFGHLDTQLYLDIEREFNSSRALNPESSMFLYKNGFLVIISVRHFPVESSEELLAPHMDFFSSSLLKDFTVGVSKIHHLKEDLAYAIRESMHASSFPDESAGRPFITFDSLGPYQPLLPFVHKPSMYGYSRSYMAPLEAYDAEKNGELVNTLTSFVKCGGDLERTGEVMSQHKNTIRYRLKRAGELLGINPFSLGDYERLALAVRIYICSGKDI